MSKLWDKVCKTDPSHTKSFSRAGGFKGTAIKPYWLMKCATDTFGECGIGWGWEELENVYVAGVWCSRVRLWYEYEGKRGQIEQWGQTQMENSRKDSDFVDEEAPKKAVTDAVVKCLSYLGFGADVHMGLFDDSKYIDEVKKDFAKSVFKTAAARKEFVQNVLNSISECQTSDEVDTIMRLNAAKIKEMKASGNEYDELGVDSIKNNVELRRAQIADSAMDEQFKEMTE